MGDAFFVRRGLRKPPMPVFTYSGSSTYTDQGGGNWLLTLKTSGTLNFTTLGTDVDVFLVGGGGAGSHQGGGGGGGYNKTVTGVTVAKHTNHSVTVGGGGSTSGASGGTSSALGNSSGGGAGGVAGTIYGRTHGVIGTGGSASNVYYYSSLTATGTSIGSGEKTVDLAYPTTGANHTNGTYLLKGVNGYYRCTIVSDGAFIGTSGSNGAGGSATYAFGGTGGTQYSGAGSAPSTVSGGANTGKGGGGSSNYNGSTFGNGGSGIVIVRNAR